jgi:Concanavalin A-like lectin/glucanases superfamily/Domain of unknown function (DUF2341)
MMTAKNTEAGNPVANKILILTIFVMPLYFVTSVYAVSWYTDTSNTNLVWTYRQQITIHGSSVEASLTNFPVLIKITDATNPVFTHAQSTGNDVLFTDSSGAIKLNHQIDYYNATVAAAPTMCAWVQMPTLASTSDSTIYMYYGCPNASAQQSSTAVWDTNYLGVWHLSEGGTGTRFDSTSNAGNGTPVDYTATTEVIGLIGKADKIWEMGATPTTSQYITFGATASNALNITSGESLTVSIWTKVATFDVVYQAIFCKGNTAWRLSRDNTNPNEAFCYNLNGSTTARYVPVTKNCTDGNWHYLVGTYNTASGAFTAYVDGTWEAISTEANANQSITNNFTVAIGFNSGSTARGFSGTVDEARVSKIDRGISWIRTEYLNQGAPTGFYALGNEQNTPSSILISRNIFPKEKYVRQACNRASRSCIDKSRKAYYAY